MPRKSRTDQELGWLRSLWEEMAQAELVHGAYFRIVVKPSATRGIFTCVFELERPETGSGPPAWKGAQALRYPNGQNTSFLCWLWGSAMRSSDYFDMADDAIREAPEPTT